MKAIILDAFYRHQEDLEGHFDSGKFVYHTGGVTVPIFNWVIGGEDKSIPCDNKNIIDFGVKTAIYKFDGKDYTQVPLKDIFNVGNVGKDTSVADYTQTFKVSELLKDKAIQPPTTLTPILRLLFDIVMLIAMIGFILTAHNTMIN